MCASCVHTVVWPACKLPVNLITQIFGGSVKMVDLRGDMDDEQARGSCSRR